MIGTQRRWRRLLLLLMGTAALATPVGARAQSTEQRLRQQREELDAIRRERADLQARLSELQGRAHDVADESQNLHRQAEATARLVRSLDRQLLAINTDVDSISLSLQRAEGEVQNRRLTLKQRMIDIYKRGPMYSTEALLSARTFGELVGRYKYLHELALRDRSVVRRVEVLYDEIDAQRAMLVKLQQELQRNRSEKALEVARLRSMEGARSRTLAELEQSQQQIRDRLVRIQRDEQRLSQLFATMEERRMRNEARPDAPAPSTSSLKASEFGTLAWPVTGDILYRFGRAVNPNNTAIRWNGIGIKAPQGTDVRAIADGEVMVADPIGTYGLTIIIQHGGGDYSVYGSLSRADVRKGDRVVRGAVIGAVGRADPDMEPHLHLEIRPKGRALDPLAWLSQGAGGR